MIIAGRLLRQRARAPGDESTSRPSSCAACRGRWCLLPGNHDHVGPGSVYDRLDLTHMAPNLNPDARGRRRDGHAARAERRAVGPQPPRRRLQPVRRRAAARRRRLAHRHRPRPLPASRAPARTARTTSTRSTSRCSTTTTSRSATGSSRRASRPATTRSRPTRARPDGLAGKTGGAVLLVYLEPHGGVRLESHPVQEHREFLHHDDLPILDGTPEG